MSKSLLLVLAILVTGCSGNFSIQGTPGPEIARAFDTRPHVTILANVIGADYGIVSTEWGVLGKILPGQQYSFPLHGQQMYCSQRTSSRQPQYCTPVGETINLFIQWYKISSSTTGEVNPERVGCSMEAVSIPGGYNPQAVIPWNISRISPPGQQCSS